MSKNYKNPPRTHEVKAFWYWKPSAKLRNEGGFKTTSLGQDKKSAFALARELNKKADNWVSSSTTLKPKTKSPQIQLREDGLTFGQLKSRYIISADFKNLRETTRKTYLACLSVLEKEFADDRASLITRARVLTWADPLRESAPQGLKHYAAVGHTLFIWGKERELVHFLENPFQKLRIKQNKRSVRALEQDLWHLVEIADEGRLNSLTNRREAIRPDLGTAMLISFYCVQRISDVLSFTSKHIENGRLRFSQSKRGAKIDMPLPPQIIKRLEDYPACGEKLYSRDGENISQEAARDGFRRLLNYVVKNTPKDQAERLKELKLRDMRRSGFVYYAEGKIENGKVKRTPLPVHLICSMSGHSIDEGMKIVEVYLPKTSSQADMAILMANSSA